MFENERDYFEALGLQAPEETADAEEQEPGAEGQSGETEDTGVNERENAEPAADGDEMVSDEPSEATSEGENEQEPAEPAEEEKPAQTKEERARNAERRRKQELDAAVERAVQAERQRSNEELKNLFAQAGFKDGENDIESVDQLKDFLARQAAQRLERELKSGTVSMESFQNAVRAEIARNQPATQPQPEPQEDQKAFMRQVAAEIREIQQYEPEIKTPADFGKLDRAEAFFDAVRNHGHSFIDAYKFVYADKIADTRARQAAAQAAQRTRNNDRSKSHLRQTGSAGSGDVAVPAAVERNIRAIMPKASAKEIRAYYQKYSKETQ